MLILGDINIDLLKFESHAEANSFIENIYSFGLSPLITKPTRITDFSATIIHHAYINIQKCATKSGMIIIALIILGYFKSYISMFEINPNNTQLSDPKILKISLNLIIYCLKLTFQILPHPIAHIRHIIYFWKQ